MYVYACMQSRQNMLCSILPSIALVILYANLSKSHSCMNKILIENTWLIHFIMISEADDQPPSFSSEELKKFQTRFDNNYNLQHDERYNLWLKHFHGSSITEISEG